MHEAEALNDDRLCKFTRGKLGEGGIKRHVVEFLDTQFAQAVSLGFGVHQTERRCIGGKKLTRMRFKGHHAERCAQIKRRLTGQINDRLMAQMDAVEIPDGRSRATIIGV